MIIFVGDKPSARMESGAKAFEGAVCEKRLKEWIEFVVDKNKYLIVNQCDYRYIEMSHWNRNGYKVIALGNSASRRLIDIPHFKLPHPSGQNRQINDKVFIKSKLNECKKYIKSQLDKK